MCPLSNMDVSQVTVNLCQKCDRWARKSVDNLRDPLWKISSPFVSVYFNICMCTCVRFPFCACLVGFWASTCALVLVLSECSCVA